MPSHTPRPTTAGRGSALATNLPQGKDHCHPKRCPAHASVCLRPVPTPSTLHPCRTSPPRNNRQPGCERECAALHLPASDPADRIRKRDSLDIRDHPSRWFEDSNRNVSNHYRGLFVDGWLPDPAHRVTLLIPGRGSSVLHPRTILLRR